GARGGRPPLPEPPLCLGRWGRLRRIPSGLGRRLENSGRGTHTAGGALPYGRPWSPRLASLLGCRKRSLGTAAHPADGQLVRRPQRAEEGLQLGVRARGRPGIGVQRVAAPLPPARVLG